MRGTGRKYDGAAIGIRRPVWTGPAPHSRFQYAVAARLSARVAPDFRIAGFTMLVFFADLVGALHLRSSASGNTWRLRDHKSGGVCPVWDRQAGRWAYPHITSTAIALNEGPYHARSNIGCFTEAGKGLQQLKRHSK